MDGENTENSVSVSHKDLRSLSLDEKRSARFAGKKIPALFICVLTSVISLLSALLFLFIIKKTDLGSVMYTAISFMTYTFYAIATFSIVLPLLTIFRRLFERIPWCGPVLFLFLEDFAWQVALFVAFQSAYMCGEFTIPLKSFETPETVSLETPGIETAPVNTPDATKGSSTHADSPLVNGLTTDTFASLFLHLRGTFSGIPSFFSKLAFIVLIFLVKNFAIHLLNYYTHYTHFAKRIRENEKCMKTIERLNMLTQSEENEDVRSVCTKILRHISVDGQTLKPEELIAFLGRQMALGLFDFLELEPNTPLTHEDLVTFYIEALKENERLHRTLIQSSNSVKSLDLICFFICLLICPFVIFSRSSEAVGTGQATKNGNVVGIMAGMIFTSGYVFSSFLGELFTSFVFVFFVRPFEIGDHIIVDEKFYKVKDINIMTSILIEDKLEVDYPNKQLSTQPITNFGVSDTWEVCYEYVFEADAFLAVKKSLLEHLKTIATDARKIFRGVPYVKDTRIIGDNEIEATIVIPFNLKRRAFSSVMRYKENFTNDLLGIFRSFGIKVVAKK